VINAWAIGRDAATWGEHAEEFMPERFAADGEAEYHRMGVDFRFLPFGGGRRGCPGVGFACRPTSWRWRACCIISTGRSQFQLQVEGGHGRRRDRWWT